MVGIRDSIRFDMYLDSWTCQCEKWGFIVENTIGKFFQMYFSSFGSFSFSGRAEWGSLSGHSGDGERTVQFGAQVRKGLQFEGTFECGTMTSRCTSRDCTASSKTNKRTDSQIIGDSQLHAIDSSKMSRTHDVKVRSQGGLKLEQLENLLRQEIKYNPDEVIAHVEGK